MNILCWFGAHKWKLEDFITHVTPYGVMKLDGYVCQRRGCEMANQFDVESARDLLRCMRRHKLIPGESVTLHPKLITEVLGVHHG